MQEAAHVHFQIACPFSTDLAFLVFAEHQGIVEHCYELLGRNCMAVMVVPRGQETRLQRVCS
jgi:hypothetical protein